MDRIDWKRKLSSRKFWVAVVNFVTLLMVANGMGENEVAQITAIIMAGAGLVAYILAEGFVDASQSDVMVVEEFNTEE